MSNTVAAETEVPELLIPKPVIEFHSELVLPPLMEFLAF